MKKNEPILTRYSDFVDEYDKYRTTPPDDLIITLIKLSNTNSPVVVDLGCGTGLSTRVWSGYAKRVTGIESSEDMINKA